MLARDFCAPGLAYSIHLEFQIHRPLLDSGGSGEGFILRRQESSPAMGDSGARCSIKSAL
jgi:hypothetical protein